MKAVITIMFSLNIVFISSVYAGEWHSCAKEGTVCNFSGQKTVAYGVSGKFFKKSISDGTACTNEIFGDPAPGIKKQCYYYEPSWLLCAKEDAYCSFSGSKQVKYGVSGAWKIKNFNDGVSCTNASFGDPAPGIKKSCYLFD